MGEAFPLPTPSDGFETITSWNPAHIITEREDSNDYALLVLNQPLNNVELLKLVWKKAKFRIAADGGANRLHNAYQKDSALAALMDEIPLNTIHGDLDSLTSSTRSWASAHNTAITLNPSQESTDFEKCIDYIRDNYLPTTPAKSHHLDIVVLGGLGGRVDQSISVLHHLYKGPELYPLGRMYLLTTSAITFLLGAGTHRVRVRETDDGTGKVEQKLGNHLGILPLGQPAVITLEGFKYDVQDWPTRIGGVVSTSNHVKDDVVKVVTNEPVLFTIDLAEDSSI